MVNLINIFMNAVIVVIAVFIALGFVSFFNITQQNISVLITVFVTVTVREVIKSFMFGDNQ
jgi:hypothetical protein